MTPQGLSIDLKSFFKSKRNFWVPETGEYHFYLSRSSWSILTVCLLKFKETNKESINIFLPEYFCNDPIPLINQENINIHYFNLDKEFKPDLKQLNSLAQEVKPDIFLAVHYFGKPSISNEIKNFCIKFKCWFIEDATHCLKKEKLIGNQGDFILFSQYKHLAIPNGALLIANTKGPSKINEGNFINFDINYFLKNEIQNLNFENRFIKTGILFSLRWLVKKLILTYFGETNFFLKFNLKKYINGLELSYPENYHSYKISLLSKFLLPRQDLDYIARTKKRNFEIFKEILDGKLAFDKNFNFRPKYNSYTPYLLPIRILNDDLDNLIKKGFPIIRWPLFPKSCINNSYKYNKLYFMLLNHTISKNYFKKICGLRVHLDKIRFKKTEKIQYHEELCLSNINLLQSNYYVHSKAEIENKKIESFEIILDSKIVGYFQILKKKYFKIFTLLRINRGPILISSLKLNDRINIFLKLLTFSNIFNFKFLSISPDVSYYSIQSLFFERFRSRKLNFPAWKSSIIDLEKEESFLFQDFRPKWRNSLRKSQKNNLVVKRSSSKKDLEVLLKSYSEDVKAKKYKGLNTELIKKMERLTNENEKLFVFTAFKMGKRIGSILISKQLANSIYLIGWSSEEGRKLNSNYLLLWEAIIYLKSIRLKRLDLGGLIGNNHPIDFFKLGMNGDYYENCGEYLAI